LKICGYFEAESKLSLLVTSRGFGFWVWKGALMAFLKVKGGFGEWRRQILLIYLFLIVDLVSSNVVLMGNNLTLLFDDVEAIFCE
jgi:hypothetical protein